MNSTASRTIARRRVASTTVHVASAIVILATAWQAVRAHAADYTWAGANALWTSSNWVTTTGTTTFPAGSSGTNSAIMNSGSVSFAGNDTFGNGATTSSPVITIGTGATLASNGFFNTIWNLNLGGGTLLANGGVNASFPTYQLAGALLVNGSTASTMSTGAGSNNMINVGGQGNATLTFNVGDVTSSTAADLTVGVILQNSQVSGGAQAGSLTKTGAGTLVLSAANTYTGATTVSGGVLQIASGGALTSAGNVNSISGGQLSIAGSVTMAANTYFAVGSGVASTSGTTTIDGGTLAVGNNAFLIGGGRGDAQSTRGTGVFTLNSGTVTVAAGGGTGGGSDTSAVWLNPYGNVGTSSLILNGGVFSTARPIRDGSASSPTMAFNGGTLQAAAGIDLIPASQLAVSIQSGGAVIDSGAFAATISNALAAGTPSGGLTKLGSGTLTLSAANTYTGTTTISAGVLALSSAGSLASTGAVAIPAAGAAFDISAASAGRTIGMLTGAAGATVALGTNALTVGNATTGTFAGVISGSGSLTKQGAGTLALTGANTYTGATSVSAGTLVIGPGGSIASAGNVNTTGGGLLSISGSVTMAANTYFAVGNGILNTTGTTSIDGGTLAVGNNAFLIGGSRNGLGSTGGLGTFVVNSGTVTVGAGGGSGGGQDVSAVWLNPYSSGTSQLILNGGVFSTARVIQNGSGGGATTLAFNGGTLLLAANLLNVTTSLSTVSIHSGGAVIDTNGFNGTFSQALATGTGATAGGLTKLGSGTLTLSVANTYSGTTRVSAGMLSIANASGIQNSTLDLNALDTGTITFGQNSTLGGLTGSRNLDMATRTLSIGNNNASTTYSGTLSNGAFTKVGSGTLTLTAPTATSVATTVSAGVLRLSGGNDRLGTSSAIAISGGTLDLGGNSQATSGGVSFTGISGLTNGTLTATAAASLVPTGTLTLGGNAAFVASRADQRILLGFGASDNFTAAGSTAGSLTYGGNDGTAANFVGVDNGSASMTVNGPTVNFRVADGQANATGGWLRIGANNGTGLMSLVSGTVNVGHSASVGAQFQNNQVSNVTGSGTLTIAGGRFTVGTGTLTTTAGGNNGYLYLKNDAAGSSGNAIVNLDGGILSVKRIVAGTGGGTKQFNFNGGTLTAASSDASFMNAANGFTVNVGNGGGTIDTGASDITIAAALLAGGSGGITKVGAGALTLSGSSTYTGPTAVNAGRLLVNGQLGNTAVTVNAGGLLGGSGSILGAVTVAGGTLSPGNSPGQLSVASLVLQSPGTVLMEITGTTAGAQYDQISITGGSLTYGGMLALDFNQTFADNTSFNLFSGFSSAIDNLTTITSVGSAYNGLTFTLSGNLWKSGTSGSQSLEFNQTTGTLVIVPEPGALALAGLGIAAAWALRRRK